MHISTLCATVTTLLNLTLVHLQKAKGQATCCFNVPNRKEVGMGIFYDDPYNFSVSYLNKIKSQQSANTYIKLMCYEHHSDINM